jgi:predicted nucleic acid-binding protein
VRFWDASALLPLILEVAESRACREAARADRSMMVWFFTRTEVMSALCRRHHAGELDVTGLRAAEAGLERYSARWDEIDAVAPVRDEADRLLHLHKLRAADALQLGAALVAADHRPRRHGFVCLDEGLGEAARREGFGLVRPGRG